MSTTPSPVWPAPEAASDPVRQPAARRSGSATAGMLVGVALVGALVGVAADRLILNAPSLGNALPAAIGRVLPRTEPAAAPPATQAPPSGQAPSTAPAPAPANPGGSTPPAAANPAQPPADATQQAIQATIQKSNEAQAQAVASKDLAGLAQAATPDFSRQLRDVTQDLIDGGVKAIKLEKIEWGPITVNGTTATATSFETWSTTFADGTTEVQRDRNQYTLVQQDGTWKIQSNTHPDALPALPGLPGLQDPGQLDPFQRRQPMPVPGFN